MRLVPCRRVQLRLASRAALLQVAALAATSLTGCATNTVIAPFAMTAAAGASAAECTPYGPEEVLPGKEQVYWVPDDASRRCDVRSRALAVKEDGKFRALYGRERDTPGFGVEDAVAPVLSKLDEEAKLKAVAGQPLRVLIFAHGGMVDHAGAVKNAEVLSHGMLTDGYVPLFLIWNSNLTVAYADRLACVRDGVRDCNYAVLAAPSRGLGDLASSVARAPQNVGGHILRFQQSRLSGTDPKYHLAREQITEVCRKIEPISSVASVQTCEQRIVFPPFSDPVHLNGQEVPPTIHDVIYFNPIWFGTRGATSLLFPELGAKAWDNMVRRTRMAFQRPARIPDAASCPPKQIPPNDDVGGFAIFFDRLACRISTASPDHALYTTSDGAVQVPIELHYYGHSMGALVGNELLSRYPELPWKRVVYMAAASPMRDFRLAAVPTLEAHSEAEFYNLTLHPLNEARERHLDGVVAQGSLLEWIDEMFEGPRSPDERIMGKWNNFAATLPLVDPRVRPRIHVRVFAKQERLPGMECGLPPRPAVAGWSPGVHAATHAQVISSPEFHLGRCHPIQHGELNDYSFWRDAYLMGPGTTSQSAQ